MIRVRMKDDPSKHRCNSCSHGRVTKSTEGQVRTSCMRGFTDPEVVYGTIVECSAYSFTYDDPPYEMKAKAWVLEVKKGRVIGFQAPKEDKDEF